MIRSDKLHAAIERFYEAEQIANAVKGCLEGTPEETALFASIDDIKDGGYVATTHAGTMAALRLLQKEVHNFASGPMTCPLIDGAMAYFDHIEMNGVDPVRDALNMVEYFPSLMEVSGTGFSALSDGLGVCIETLGAIVNQPRCGDGGGSLNAAGEYLEGLEQFLMFEQRRIIEAAAKFDRPERNADAEARLRTVFAFKAMDADLSANRLEELIGLVDNLDNGRASA